MRLLQNRRHFLTNLTAAGAAGVLGSGGALADEGPPETTTIRLRRDPGICIAPWYIAEDLLRAEGFTDVRYVDEPEAPRRWSGAASSISALGCAVGRLPPGCRPADHGAGGRASRLLRAVRTRADPHHRRPEGQEGRHRRAGLGQAPYVAIMAAHVGLDPRKDIEWVEGSDGNRDGPVPHGDCSPKEKSMRFSAFPPSRRSCVPARSAR